MMKNSEWNQEEWLWNSDRQPKFKIYSIGIEMTQATFLDKPSFFSALAVKWRIQMTVFLERMYRKIAWIVLKT